MSDTLGSTLREIRAERGLTLRQAAERGKNLSPTGLLRIEGGSRDNPRINTLMAIARSLNVTIEIAPDGVSVTDHGDPDE